MDAYRAFWSSSPYDRGAVNFGYRLLPPLLPMLMTVMAAMMERKSRGPMTSLRRPTDHHEARDSITSSRSRTGVSSAGTNSHGDHSCDGR